MLVTEHSMGTLVVEEGRSSSLIVGGSSTVIGAVLIAIGIAKDQYLWLVVAAIFLYFGVQALVFSRARTHRFDRLRRKVVIEAKGLRNSEVREIPFESIADVIVEKKGRKSPPSLYLYYVLRDGERVAWAESYDGAREETLECARAAREVLELPPAKDAPGSP